MWNFPEAHPGDDITAEIWDTARAAVMAMRLLQGEGIRLKWSANGVTISASPDLVTFQNPFKCSLKSQGKAAILTGLINGQEPLINGVYLSGPNRDGNQMPVLDFGDPLLGNNGAGYIATQFQCDNNWVLIPKSLTIVQVPYYDSLNGTPPPNEGGAATSGGIPGLPGRMVRCPLAMLRKLSSGQVILFQIPYFNLAHKADPRGNDQARHFFWPAPG
ncbi:MAG TPA: hypothetical protein VGM54_09920 [Chthoniobacter sp.]|jgi:hypothetical protein